MRKLSILTIVLVMGISSVFAGGIFKEYSKSYANIETIPWNQSIKEVELAKYATTKTDSTLEFIKKVKSGGYLKMTQATYKLTYFFDESGLYKVVEKKNVSATASGGIWNKVKKEIKKQKKKLNKLMDEPDEKSASNENTGGSKFEQKIRAMNLQNVGIVETFIWNAKKRKNDYTSNIYVKIKTQTGGKLGGPSSVLVLKKN